MCTRDDGSRYEAQWGRQLSCLLVAFTGFGKMCGEGLYSRSGSGLEGARKALESPSALAESDHAQPLPLSLLSYAPTCWDCVSVSTCLAPTQERLTAHRLCLRPCAYVDVLWHKKELLCSQPQGGREVWHTGHFWQLSWVSGMLNEGFCVFM